MLKAMKAAPAPIWVLIASFLCPTELSLYLGGLRLPPHRLALLVLFPIACVRFMRRRDLRLRSYDVLFILYNAWTVAVFMIHQGDGEGLQFGGSLALESLASYVVARVWVRDEASFIGALHVLMAAIAVAGLIAFPEAIFGIHYVHDTLKALTGYDHPIGHETRLFLTRAYGTFDHPIHFGTFCASVLAMVWYSIQRRPTRRWQIVVLSVSTFLAVSSAPILCLALQTALIVWDRVTRGIRARVGITLAMFVAFYIGATIVGSRSPLTIIATGFTIDSWTGFYRTVIWEWGLHNVWMNPWIGIGLADWVRPDWMFSSTVDRRHRAARASRRRRRPPAAGRGSSHGAWLDHVADCAVSARLHGPFLERCLRAFLLFPGACQLDRRCAAAQEGAGSPAGSTGAGRTTSYGVRGAATGLGAARGGASGLWRGDGAGDALMRHHGVTGDRVRRAPAPPMT